MPRQFLDDRAGLVSLLGAIDGLADDPEPPGATELGGELRRLRVGRYRVMYEITSSTVTVIHVGRTA